MSESTDYSSNDFLQNKKNGIELFEQLGLNNMQARIYLSLAISGTSTVSQISKITKIARQDIYKVISTLTTLGLLDKFIEKPVKYRAVQIKDGISRLINLRDTKNALLDKNVNKFIQKFSTRIPKEKEKREKYELIIIPEKTTLTKKIKTAIKKTKRSIDVIIPGKDLTKVLISFSDNFEEVANRNVKIRLISCKKENAKGIYNKTRALRDNSAVEVKISNKTLKIRGGIYDREKIFVAINPGTETLGSPVLFSYNPTLVELFQSYFDRIWNTC